MKKMNTNPGMLILVLSAVSFVVSASAMADCTFGNARQLLDEINQCGPDAQCMGAVTDKYRLDVPANLVPNPNTPSGQTYKKTVDGVTYWAILYGPNDPETQKKGSNFVQVEIVTPDGQLSSGSGKLVAPDALGIRADATIYTGGFLGVGAVPQPLNVFCNAL